MSSSATAPAAEMINLTRVFREGWNREVVALRDLTLTVRSGEIYGFLGPNGAGKTTALHCLLGLLPPTSGRVRLFGEEVGTSRAPLRRVGFMPEDWTCYDFLTVREMLSYFADLYGIPRAGLGSSLTRALERVGLAGHAKRKLRRLSKGMRQRAALAQAILAEPRLLILDEPTKELDPVGRLDVRTLLREMADKGATILMSSHLLSEVERVCDRIGVIHQGRLIVEGDLDTLLSRRESRRVRFTLPAETSAPEGAAREDDGAFGWTAETQQDLYLRLDRLSRLGAEILSVQPESIRLEDYFIQVVGRA